MIDELAKFYATMEQAMAGPYAAQEIQLILYILSLVCWCWG